MADEIGQGGTITRDAFYYDGSSVLTDVVDPQVSIIDSVGATRVNLAAPTHVSTGHYQYEYAVPVDGPLGAWIARWFGVINGQQVGPDDDNFTVVPAGHVDFPDDIDTLMLTCQPWMTPGDLSLCGVDTFTTPEIAARVLQGATDLLYVASGRQYPGVCTDDIRPGSAHLLGIGERYAGAGPLSGYFAPAFGSTADDGSTWLSWGTETLPIGARPFATMQLPNWPVVDVLEVQIGDVMLTHAGGDFFIMDDRWLIRADGHSWPWLDRLDHAPGESDTWRIKYRWGTPPPMAGIIALDAFVCELGKGWKGDKTCRLPKRLQSITREGMTAVILDPFTFLDKGRFGVYEIDSFLSTVNPHGLDRDGKVLNVDLVRTRSHHVR